MATKDFSFSTKKKKNDSYFKDSSNDKYRNLNLNLGHKYSDNCFGETKSSKFGLKNDSYKFSGAFNSFKEEKNKSLFDSDKSWKTSFQQERLGSRYLNISKVNDNKISKNALDSRDRGFSFSDHIQKNMHLYESPAADDEILTFKKDKKKFKNAIEKCLPSSADLQDSWEFPRQQEEDPAPEPEVMQFTASQKLLHPSQNDESTADMFTSLPNDDDFDNSDDGAGSAYLAGIIDQEQSEIADDNSFIGEKFKGDQTKSFTITSKIAKGGFGAVYRCVEDDDESGKELAIKCSDEEDFKMEIEVLKKANDAKTKHIYRFIDSGIDKDHDRIFIVVDLLGKSLADILEDKKGVEWDSLKWKVAEQCLIGLQNLHGLGYLHLDIKQNNFAMGLGENEFMVFLIDFGLSLKNGSSREQSEEVNECYSSIATMAGKKLGPKDDIESLMYLVNEFLGGQLPWEQLEDDNKEDIMKMKKDLRNDQSNIFQQFFGEADSLFKEAETGALTPHKKTAILNEDKRFPELLLLMRYIDTLKAENLPDYDRILFYLQSGYERAHQKAKIEFDEKMEKLKGDDKKDERVELQKKFDAKEEEIRKLSIHCRTPVERPQDIAFFVQYGYRKDKKVMKAIEYNGRKMTLNNLIKDGLTFGGDGLNVQVAYDGKQQIGEEAKIIKVYHSKSKKYKT